MSINDWKPIQRIGKKEIAINDINGALFEISIALLAFFTLITPRDAMGFKKIFLALSLVFGITAIIEGLKRNFQMFIFAAFLPVSMYIESSMMTGSLTSAISYLYPFVYLLLLFPIFNWNINIEKITLIIGNIMACIILISVALDFSNILDIYNNPILLLLNNNDEAQISKSIYAMFRYVIFLNACPILLFNLMHYIKKNKLINALLIFLALLFTGTRANIFLGALILFISMLFYSKNKWVKIIVIATGIIAALFFGTDLISKYQTINFAKSSGDQIRRETVESIFNALNCNKRYWITGMGFGSSYYYSGINGARSGMMQTSEMSYLELIREVGIPFSLLTIGFILYPLFKVFKFDKYYSSFYAAYLIAGFFEPFIFTSTGFFVIMIMYYEMYKNEGNVNNVYMELLGCKSCQ